MLSRHGAADLNRLRDLNACAGAAPLPLGRLAYSNVELPQGHHWTVLGFLCCKPGVERSDVNTYEAQPHLRRRCPSMCEPECLGNFFCFLVAHWLYLPFVVLATTGPPRFSCCLCFFCNLPSVERSGVEDLCAKPPRGHHSPCTRTGFAAVLLPGKRSGVKRLLC